MEIKTRMQIKDEVVQTYGYESFDEFDDKLTFGREAEIIVAVKIIDEVAKEYTSQCIDLALKKYYWQNPFLPEGEFKSFDKALLEIKDLINKEGEK